MELPYRCPLSLVARADPAQPAGRRAGALRLRGEYPLRIEIRNREQLLQTKEPDMTILAYWRPRG